MLILRKWEPSQLNSKGNVKKLVFFCSFSEQQESPESPCPKIFNYQFNGNEWFALIQPQSFLAGPTITFEVTLSLRAELPSVRSLIGFNLLYNKNRSNFAYLGLCCDTATF